MLKEPINLEEFEELPFVRSLFFRYQLAFPTQYMKSVMSTDQTGENILSPLPPLACHILLLHIIIIIIMVCARNTYGTNTYKYLFRM